MLTTPTPAVPAPISIPQLPFYQHFLSTLNTCRLEQQKPPVWLDLQTLGCLQTVQTLGQRQSPQTTFTHGLSQPLPSNPHLLSDFTHISLSMGDGSCRLIKATTRTMPLAVDSIVRRNGRVELGAVLLDQRYQLWGFRVFSGLQQQAVIYPPNRLNRYKRNDFTVTMDLTGGEYIEVYMVKSPSPEISYGKNKYYYGLPENSEKVYAFKFQFEVRSVLDEVAAWANKRRSGLVREFRTFQGEELLRGSKGMQLFKEMSKEVKVTASMNKVRPTRDENMTSEYKSSVRRIVEYVTPKVHQEEEEEFDSIFDPKVNQFFTKKENNQPNSISLNNITTPKSTTTLYSAKPTSSKPPLQPTCLFPQPSTNNFPTIQNLSPPLPNQQPTIPPTIFSNKAQLNLFLHSLSKSLTPLSTSPIPSKPTLTLITSQRRFQVSQPLLCRYSSLISDALLSNSQTIHEIHLDDFTREAFEGFLEMLIDGTGTVLRLMPVQIALEVLQITRYLKVSGMMLERVLVSNLLPNISPRILLTLLPLLPTLQQSSVPHLATLILTYWQECSKQLFHSFPQELLTALKQLPEELVVEMVELGLENVVDSNHMMDLLGVLVGCGWARNVVEIVEKRLSARRNDKNEEGRRGEERSELAFVKKKYQLPKGISKDKAVLVEEFEGKLLASYTVDNPSHHPPNPLPLSCSSTPTPSYHFKSRPRPHSLSSPKWLLLCQEFRFSNRRWRLLIEFDQGKISCFLCQLGPTCKLKLPLHYLSLAMTFQATIDCIELSHTTVTSFSLGQDEAVGGVVLEAYNYGDFSVEVKVFLKVDRIHSYGLQHLGMRWRELLKWQGDQTDKCEQRYQVQRRASIDMGRRRSCVILQSRMAEQVQCLSFQTMFSPIPSAPGCCLYSLHPINVYFLFSSVNLRIQDQSLLLFYLSKYYLYNPGCHCFLPLTTLKLSCIRLRNLLSVTLYHPVLKAEPVFMGRLERELARRFGGGQAKGEKGWAQGEQGEQVRNGSETVKAEQGAREIVEWLRSGHFEVFKRKYRGILHKSRIAEGVMMQREAGMVQESSELPPQQTTVANSPQPPPQTIASTTHDCTLF